MLETLSSQDFKEMVSEAFDNVAGRLAAAGYKHFLYFPTSDIQIGPRGQLDIHYLSAALDVNTLYRDFAAGRLALSDLYTSLSGTENGTAISFIGFTTAEERERLAQCIFALPYFADRIHAMCKADWEDGSLTVYALEPESIPHLD